MAGIRTPHITRVTAIAGIPGSGKSTLAKHLAKEFDLSLLTMHDLVQEVDPESLVRGDMANELLIRQAFIGWMAQHANERIVIDGWPRSEPQALLLPPDARVILLVCRTDIARDRLLLRDRSDDRPHLVDKRIAEQSALLAANGGWAYRLSGWEGRMNTSLYRPEDVCRSVTRYMTGEKDQASDGVHIR